MAMLNGMDHFSSPWTQSTGSRALAERPSLLRQALQDSRIRAHNRTRDHGEDSRNQRLNPGPEHPR